jgi:acyl carrier protein
LALVELLFEIERVFGVTLPLEELEVDSLRTTRRIGELVRQVQDPKDP